MAYTVVGLPPSLLALTDALEQSRSRRCRQSISFISQDAFNDIIRYGTVYDVALAIEKHREAVVGFDSKGMSPLMSAADRASGSRQELEIIVTLLIKAGAKMDAGRYSQRTPLCYAATKAAHVVRVFIKHETNWDLYASFEVKPWQVALRTSSENFLVMLPYVPSRLLVGYNATGHTLLIELILERPELVPKVASELPFRNMANITDINGEAPLAHAAKLDDRRFEVVTALFRCGAMLLFYRNGHSVFWADRLRPSTPGTEYIRARVRYACDQVPYDFQYDAWYEQMGI